MKRASLFVTTGLAGVLTAIAGCSVEEAADPAVQDENVIADDLNPDTIDKQRNLCVLRVRENGALREQDLAFGVVRWKCGDVAGVSGTDHGQEYCEFHAVQEGVVIDEAPKSKIKPAKVECLFTGVYGDVKGLDSPETKAYGEKLNRILTEEPGNLRDAKGKTLPAGPKAQRKLGNPFSVMNFSANTRNAADGLLESCSALAPQNADRINASSDAQECDGSGSQCASPRDVEACTLIFKNGKGWRNSDPVICGRAARGALCGAKYSTLPGAVDGFVMTDWNADLVQAAHYAVGKSASPPSPPDGCRYALVDGKPYLHMLLCTPTQAQVTNPKYEGQAQRMCNDVFGPKIAMTAPLGLVTSEAKGGDPFCDAFTHGVDALQNGVK